LFRTGQRRALTKAGRRAPGSGNIIIFTVSPSPSCTDSRKFGFLPVPGQRRQRRIIHDDAKAGSEDRGLSLAIPAAMLATLKGTRHSWAFTGEPEPQLNNHRSRRCRPNHGKRRR